MKVSGNKVLTRNSGSYSIKILLYETGKLLLQQTLTGKINRKGLFNMSFTFNHSYKISKTKKLELLMISASSYKLSKLKCFNWKQSANYLTVAGETWVIAK